MAAFMRDLAMKIDGSQSVADRLDWVALIYESRVNVEDMSAEVDDFMALSADARRHVFEAQAALADPRLAIALTAVADALEKKNGRSVMEAGQDKGTAVVSTPPNVELRIVDGRVSAFLSFCSVEQAGMAVEAIKAFARVQFPDIAFIGDPGFDDDEPAKKASRGGARMIRGVKPGSPSDLVLQEARRRGDQDAAAIAAALGKVRGPVAMTLARLRAGGLLPQMT